jgi:ADP-glucose pyrophosphorylase
MATANTVQQQIYRLAYQRAQAAVQVPRHYRLLFSVWN